jgi:hypothetical protein
MGSLLKIVAPLALSFLAPGLGTALGAGLGASGAAAGVLGNSLIGAGLGAVGGGGLKGALLGGITGGASSALSGSGILGKAASNFPKSGVGPFNPGSGLSGAASRIGNSISSLSPIASGGGASSFGGIGNIASNVYSGVSGMSAQDKARKQLLQGQNNALGQLKPYTQTGASANARLAQMLGLDPNADQDTITNALRSTPGYQFQLEQGTQSADRANAARGGFFSGAALREAQQYGQGLADNTYNQYIDRLSQQSGQGLNAAGGAANIYGNIGDVNANATVAKNNLMSQSLSNILNPQPEMVYDPATGTYKMKVGA